MNEARSEVFGLAKLIFPLAALGLLAWFVVMFAEMIIVILIVLIACGLAWLGVLCWRGLAQFLADKEHQAAVRKAEQDTAWAMAERARIQNQAMLIENQAALARVHLVELTADVQLVSIDQLDARAAYTLLSQRIATLEKRVPDSMHLTVKEGNRLPATVESEPVEVSRVEPLSVMECFARGLFSDPAKLLTGFEGGNAIYSPVERTYGVCVAGLPGMGKSNGMRFYALQMVLHGAQMAIIDPAANSASGEGLAASFERHLWAPMAIDPDEIVGLLRQINRLGERRDSGQDADQTPLLLLADEVTSLITDEEHGTEIKALLMRINRKHRKNKIYTIGAGQDWLSGAQGGDTSLRNTYVCKAVFRIDRMNAGKLLPNARFVPLAPELPEGSAIWVGHDAAPHVIDIPYCPAEVVAAILGQNTQPQASQVVEALPRPLHKPLPQALPDDDEEMQAEEGYITLKLDPHRVAWVRRLIAEGASNGQILREVFGLEKLAGRAYQQANQELQEIVRYLVTRGT